MWKQKQKNGVFRFGTTGFAMRALNELIGKIPQARPRGILDRLPSRAMGITKNQTALMVSFCVLFFGAASAGAQQDIQLWSRNAPYRLCANDVISLRFPVTPEFDQTAAVRPDGYVSLDGV